VYPGFTQIEWYDKIYPTLSGEDIPMECVQEAGEILYLVGETTVSVLTFFTWYIVKPENLEANASAEALVKIMNFRILQWRFVA
jgi:hypothetical protein